MRRARQAAALAAVGLALAVPAAARTQAAPPPQAAPGLTLAEAVRTTLVQSPAIAAAEWGVEAQRGALRQAQGAFDPELAAGVASDRAQTPGLGQQGGTTLARSSALEYRLGVDQRLRSGVVVSPSLAVRRTDLGAGQAPSSRAELSTALVVPLLRGRGGTLARAGERAATHELAGSVADLRHRRAESVLDAVLAYWDYAAATRRLEVLKEAEGRAATLLSETEALIRADARPAIDAVPLRATLASKRADRIAGEQSLLGARQALAVAMGISPAQFLALAPPSTPFPELAAGALPPAPQLVDEALRQRADLAAARSREEAAQAFLSGARTERRPQMDLRLTAGVSGLESGENLRPLLTPFYRDRSGFHLEMDVSWAVPVRNRAAEGLVLQRAAAGRQAGLEVAELTRTATLDVLTAAESLKSALAGLEQAAEAVRLHLQAVDAEKAKFRLGTSTLFDVLFAEDALTGATLGEIAARGRVAAALATLRFHSGALSGGEGGEGVDAALLTTWRPAGR
jgi:outer membrane protein TolC